MNALSEKRKTYDQILQQVMAAYFRGCKTEYRRVEINGSTTGKLGQVLGFLFEDMDYQFDHPIERLM